MWAASGCLVLIVAIALLSTAPLSDEILRRPSTFFTGPSGARGIYLVLQRVLPSVEQWRLPLTELKQAARRDAGTLIVMGPGLLGQAEAGALNEWIGSGGQLILVANDGWVIQGSARSPEQTFLAQHGISAVKAVGRAVKSATIKTVRKGRIVYVSDPHAFSNSSLGKTDNAVWLAERCSEWGNRVRFDEYHLGFVQQRGLISIAAMFAVTPWGLICVQLSLAGLVYLFGCRRRFGRPLEELPVERTNPVETVQALGGLLKSTRARALAARTMQQHLNAQVSAIVGHPVDLMNEETRERLAGSLRIQRDGLESYAKKAQAAGSGKSSDAELIQFAQEATAVARSFSHGVVRGRRTGAVK